MTSEIAVVTGGASGIGKAISRKLAQEGFKVMVADKNADAARAVGQDIGGAGFGCDVTQEEQIKDLISTVEADHGPIELFCSNAGLGCGQPNHAASASNSVWQLNWDIHVMAHVYACRALLPAMTARGHGTLVNVASAAGLLNQIEDAAYSATKHAAVSFAESLAISHADEGIRVAVVCPQYVATPLLDMDESQPLTGNLIAPETVADSLWEGLQTGKFMILPHPQVSDFYKTRAAAPEKWIGGMQALRRKILADTEKADLREMYKYI